MYFNARSLLPKIDELVVLADDGNPDVICITDTWLSGEICDTELSIDGYFLYRRDRDRHGGGVLLYVKESIEVKALPQCPDLELITLSLYKDNNRICISVFYRPPSTSANVFSQVSAYFDNLCITQFSNFIFLGDFNVNFKDPTHPCYKSLSDIMSLYSLSQVVDDSTHIHHNGTASTIDLVLMSSPSQLIQCGTIPPLANSDHNGLLVVTKWKTAAEAPTRRQRKIWRYTHANWDRARELIGNCNWDSFLSDDVNTSWSKWQQEFMSIMDQCIPKRLLPPSKNLPWMNKNLKQAMRRRNAFYKYGKRTGDYSKFKSARNRFVAQLRRSKKDYFAKMNPRDMNFFWKTVKSLKKSCALLIGL